MKGIKPQLSRFAKDDRGDLLIEFIIGAVLVAIISVAGIGFLRNSQNTTESDLINARNIFTLGVASAMNYKSGTTLTVTPSGSGSKFVLTGVGGSVISTITTQSSFVEVQNGERQTNWTVVWNHAGIIEGCTTQTLPLLQVSPYISGGSRSEDPNCFN